MASEDEQPANIRSRIAAFEGISGTGTAAKPQQIQTQRKASDPPKLPAKPVLPPRKAGSGSSTLSVSDAAPSTSSAGNQSGSGTAALTGIARPPPPKPTVTRSPAQSISLSSPPALSAASASSSPSASLSSSLPKPPSRSSTLSSTSSTATNSAPVLPPRPGSSTPTPVPASLTSTSPRASPAPPVIRRMLPPEVRPASPGSIANKGAAFSVLVPPHRNGTATESQASARRQQPISILKPGSTSQGNVVAVPKRYMDLWERLVQAVKPTSTVEDARIEGIYIREIWTKSKLRDDVLARIWLQCDPQKTGSLTRQGFVKGMGLIDDQLRENAQRRRLQR